MMAITAESRGQTFCFLSDLLPMTPHAQPTWVTAFDLYPLQSIESKMQWLAAAANLLPQENRQSNSRAMYIPTAVLGAVLLVAAAGTAAVVWKVWR